MTAAAFPPRRSYTVPLSQGRHLALGARCLVMGIVNVTPDSFAEAAPLLDPARAVDAALRMQDDGADLIDVGGESTRPGAGPVSVDEELRRVLPVVERLSSRLQIPISVDTSKARVAADAVAAGAAIVNDVRGLRDGPSLAEAIAPAGAALVLMHSRGTPQTMGEHAAYDDLMGEIARELQEAILRARAAGVLIGRVIVDPGIGFAKRPEHSYGVLARLPALAAALDRPILAGPSRKSFLREAVVDRPAAGRDWGTAAAVAAAVLAGAHIVRVHAVTEMVQVVRVAEAIRKEGQRAEGRDRT
jgi:dihydropteroate synthase